MQGLPELGVLPHAVAVAADRHDVAVVDEPIDQRRRHHVVAEDLAPLFKAFVGRQHRRGVLVAARHQLKEQHGAGPADREVADFIDDEQGRMREHLEPGVQATSGLGFFQRRNQIGERA